MRKLIFLIAALGFMLGFAQDEVNKSELLTIAAEQESEYEAAKTLEEVKYADHRMIGEVGFQGFDNGTPVYFSNDSRSQFRSMNVDYLWNETIPGVAVTGDGMTVYIWDGGKLRTTHQEFEGRAVNTENSGSNSSHATGVAGVIMSKGVQPNARGMAYEANLKAFNFNVGNTISEIAQESAKTENSNYMVSNHSYGSLTGWSRNGSTWYWYGYPHISETESVLFGLYVQQDANYDRTAYNAPQHSIFKSSGNNQGEGPAGVVTHYAFDENGNWQEHIGVHRPKDCVDTGGYDCISWAGSVAKNIILVGAIRPLGSDGRYHQPSDVKATSFTSFGPTDDGRIKPDIVAIGQSVQSPTDSGDSAYSSWDGTSFSSPAAAGVAVLLQQVKKDFDGGYLRSDMMKALLINTAFESGDHPGPDYKFGFGLIDAFKAAETIVNANDDSFMASRRLFQGETITVQFTAASEEPIKAAIAWLDPQGTASPLILNDRTPKLINDLDIRITKDSSTTYYPWKLDPDNPSAAATKGDNIVDNAEQIVIEDPVPGASYTLKITHKGNLSTPTYPAPEVNYQDFAMVITGVNSIIGTKDVDLSGAVSFYPNPVKDKLNIRFNQNLKNPQLRIFNLMGQVVTDRKIDSYSISETIDMSGLAPGNYMIYIKSDEGIITHKIIKK